MRQPNIHGGGANTNLNGLRFQQSKTLANAIIEHPELMLIKDSVFRKGIYVAELCGGYKLYTKILRDRNVDFTKYISKRMFPDDAILVRNTVYIIEKKFQNVAGSVDEKLQTCDFKKKQYTKLLLAADLRAEYYYVLNDWFRKAEYTDVHNYIESVGCKYFFNVIPLSEIGL